MLDRMSKDMPNKMSKDMLDKISENILDNMSEDLSIIKYINIIIRIIRNKIYI